VLIAAGALQISGRLDASAAPGHSLCISASDAARHNTSVQLNVTVVQTHAVTDPPLQFSQSFYVFDVAEDAALGVTVGQVRALEAVVGHQASSSSSPPTYAIASRGSSDVFRLNATHGLLTLATNLDHETVCRCCTLPYAGYD